MTEYRNLYMRQEHPGGSVELHFGDKPECMTVIQLRPTQLKRLAIEATTMALNGSTTSQSRNK